MNAMFPALGEVESEDVVLELKNVTTEKVADISFSLRKGEILGITGLVGSGRTELTQAIFGLDKLIKGEIYVNGSQVRINGPHSAMKNRIFLAPEDRKGDALVLIRPIRENITLSNLKIISKFGWCNTKTELNLVDRLCSQIRVITNSWETLVENLSGGNQQKVVIAKAIAAQPNILIFDEPTQGIDVGAKSEIYTLLEELRKEGMSIVLISSEIEEVQRKCNRIFVMRNGHIVGEVDDQLDDSKHILSLMYRSEGA